MTRANQYNRGAKNYGPESTKRIITTHVMGLKSDASHSAFGRILESGNPRILQAASSLTVQKGIYLKQQPHAFAHIAEQICKGPKPK